MKDGCVVWGRLRLTNSLPISFLGRKYVLIGYLLKAPPATGRIAPEKGGLHLRPRLLRSSSSIEVPLHIRSCGCYFILWHWICFVVGSSSVFLPHESALQCGSRGSLVAMLLLPCISLRQLYQHHRLLLLIELVALVQAAVLVCALPLATEGRLEIFTEYEPAPSVRVTEKPRYSSVYGFLLPTGSASTSKRCLKIGLTSGCVAVATHFRLIHTAGCGRTFATAAAPGRALSGASDGPRLFDYRSVGAADMQVPRRQPASFGRVSTESETSPHRLLRIRKRNIRFLCGSRRNRARGLPRPAAAAAVARHNSADDAFVQQSLRLEDPLVAQPPTTRWRTQW